MLAAGQRIGGYCGRGGIVTKRFLLELEGAAARDAAAAAMSSGAIAASPHDNIARPAAMRARPDAFRPIRARGERHGRYHDPRRRGGSFSAYLAPPEERAKGPGILVIQEIFGVNKVMRDSADGFAAQGYVALCPDLFWRQEPGIQITDKTEAEWAARLPALSGLQRGQGRRAT